MRCFLDTLNIQAGLLTPGSFYFRAFPSAFAELLLRSAAARQWRCGFVPDYSGGTALVSNELPFKALAGTRIERNVKEQRYTIKFCGGCQQKIFKLAEGVRAALKNR